MDNLTVLGYLEEILGKSVKKSKSNYGFPCPFCNHSKPKLEINLEIKETKKNPWECWSCKTKGKTVFSLLKQLNIDLVKIKEVTQYVKKDLKDFNKSYEIKKKKDLVLPKEFVPLSESPKNSFIANRIKKILYERGLTDLDILAYNIGYCVTGDYSERIIIPSYDADNKLNYFTARTYVNNFNKYKNPEVERDTIVVFENLINWELPIVLIEGMFDAITVKRNSIPILGTVISSGLRKKIIESKTDTIYVALDPDAFTQSFKQCEELIRMGKRVFFVKLDANDPNKEGFHNMVNIINEAKELTLSTLLKYKLKII